MTLLRLPNGVETTDFLSYTAAWRELGREVEAHAGWRLLSVGDEFEFESPDRKGVIFLPLEAAQQMVKNWRARAAADELLRQHVEENNL